jgi:hypothetical protein
MASRAITRWPRDASAMMEVFWIDVTRPISRPPVTIR